MESLGKRINLHSLCNFQTNRMIDLDYKILERHCEELIRTKHDKAIEVAMSIRRLIDHSYIDQSFLSFKYEIPIQITRKDNWFCIRREIEVDLLLFTRTKFQYLNANGKWGRKKKASWFSLNDLTRMKHNLLSKMTDQEVVWSSDKYELV